MTNLTQELLNHLTAINQTNLLTKKEVKKNEVVFREGETGEELYLIESGRVGIYKIADPNTGQEKELAILKNGDFFGETALFDETLRSATVKAIEDSQLLVIKRSDLHNLLESDAKNALNIILKFLQVTNHRLQQMNQQLVLLYQVSRLIAKHKKDLDLLCGEVLKRVIEVSNADKAALFLKESFSDSFIGKAGFDRACNQLPPAEIATMGSLIWKIKDEEYLKDQNYLLIPIRSIEDCLIGSLIMATATEPSEEKIRLSVAVAEQLGSAFSAVNSYQDQKTRQKLEEKRVEF